MMKMKVEIIPCMEEDRYDMRLSFKEEGDKRFRDLYETSQEVKFWLETLTARLGLLFPGDSSGRQLFVGFTESEDDGLVLVERKAFEHFPSSACDLRLRGKHVAACGYVRVSGRDVAWIITMLLYQLEGDEFIISYQDESITFIGGLEDEVRRMRKNVEMREPVCGQYCENVYYTMWRQKVHEWGIQQKEDL